jgi:crotonobetainyl-CoA:carnitine CoA-transferase CaiB-like acyl-CoA transferase
LAGRETHASPTTNVSNEKIVNVFFKFLFPSIIFGARITLAAMHSYYDAGIVFRSRYAIFIVLPPPLTGVRVLDLSTVVAGPTATMILADLGADIIKVERIDGGDDARDMGPHRGKWGAYFTPINRGKRSIAVDITKPAGRETVLRLAQRCDVFIENFRVGKAAGLGLDEAAVRARKSDVIYASLSAYGSSGPDCTKPGYDAILQARTGIVSVTGPNADTPIRAGVSILDMGAGVWMALGILAALFERKNSGRGQRVDASLFQTGVMLMCYHLLYRQFSGVNPGPQGSRHASVAPYGAFSTTDGAVMIGISNDRLFRRLCTAVGHDEWTEDPMFCTNTERVHNRSDLEGRIENILRTKATAEWLQILNKHDVPCDAIQNAEQVMNDPQIAALDQLVPVALAGELSADVPRLPFSLSVTPPEVAGPPPALGEHGREILLEAGFAASEIDELARCGACAFGS